MTMMIIIIYQKILDNDLSDNDLNFEVPYDLHHYKNPEYKLIAAILYNNN